MSSPLYYPNPNFGMQSATYGTQFNNRKNLDKYMQAYWADISKRKSESDERIFQKDIAEKQIAARAAEGEKTRTWKTGESAAERAWKEKEAAATRAWRTEESAKDTALKRELSQYELDSKNAVSNLQNRYSILAAGARSVMDIGLSDYLWNDGRIRKYLMRSAIPDS